MCVCVCVHVCSMGIDILDVVSQHQVILKHFHLRKTEVLSQCVLWREELADGIRKMQENGDATTNIKRHLYNLDKSLETLRSELDKIKVADFEGQDTIGDHDMTDK